MEEQILAGLRELLPYLRKFQRPTVKFASGPTSLKKNKDGSLEAVSPTYSPDVVAFFQLVSQVGDTSYEPEQSAQILNTPGALETADLVAVRRVLTFIMRSERFCDGAWLADLESGVVTDVLERLQALLTEKPDHKRKK